MRIFLVFISIILGAGGQLFLKLAAKNTAETAAMFSYYFALLKSPFIYLGALCYGLSFLLWMRLLKIFDLSYIRPLVGLGYIVTALLSLIVLKEKITPLRWVGIALIVAGVYLVGTSVKN